MGRFRTAIGEELLKATIDTAVSTQAVRPAEFERIIVDCTVREKAIAHPVDSRLLEIARAKVVQSAKVAGIQPALVVAGDGASGPEGAFITPAISGPVGGVPARESFERLYPAMALPFDSAAGGVG